MNYISYKLILYYLANVSIEINIISFGNIVNFLFFYNVIAIINFKKSLNSSIIILLFDVCVFIIYIL